MYAVPGYEGRANPFRAPIESLTAVGIASYNHRAIGIWDCESMFHLASTIVGGCDLIEEFVAANIWPISHGWAPREIVNYNVNWATQEVPFPRFGLKLMNGQSTKDFMDEVEKKVNTMIGQYTMNEYKAYKNLVKHKKKINQVFSEICGERSFPSRRPGPPVKMLCVAVASRSAAPPKALRTKSSKKSQGTPEETTSSGVHPVKTKSLESTKRKRRASEQVSDVELQAASSIAQMSRKKAKKAIKKIVATEVRRVPSAFDDDLFTEPKQKGSFFWPLLIFDFREHCPSGFESEFVDIDSFSDTAPEVRKEIIPDAAAEPLLLPPKLSFLSLLVHGKKHLHNSPRNLILPFIGVKIPFQTFPWLKFANLSLKVKILLLLWPPSTKALVRRIAVNC
jgi:hypothetical protein